MTVQDYSLLPTPLQQRGFRTAIASAPLAAGTLSLLRQNARTVSALNCVDLNAFSVANCGAFLPAQVVAPIVLYVKGDKWTIIDFATESTSWAHRYRKLYNAILNLDRLNCLRMTDAKTSVDYVLVTPQVSPKIRTAQAQRGALSTMHQHFDARDSEPWEYDVARMRREGKRIDHDVRRMSDYLVRKAFFVFPSELDQYVLKNGWKN